jgi:hypothetical protein
MSTTYRRRRLITVLISIIALVVVLVFHQNSPTMNEKPTVQVDPTALLATTELQKLTVKGRAPKTDYARTQFGDGWTTIRGCDTRNIILHRDLTNTSVDEDCNVISGTLNDPYTGKVIEFKRGSSSSADVQIDHVVALSDAWQKGAQQLTRDQRIALANDPLELLAVDGPANQQKSDGDAATWLPPYKAFRCQYVARQIAVKQKYVLWVTQAEKDAMANVLAACPMQAIPTS